MKFDIIRNDITDMKVDAIVLPANMKLKEGKGTSNAIFEKAGREQLTKACKKLLKENRKDIFIGNTLHTLGFNLDTKYIFHTIIPKWKDNNSEEENIFLLSASYFSALKLADDIGCETLAFPLLASGNNGFEIKLAFEIAKNSIEHFKSKEKLSQIYLVVYDREVISVLKNQNIAVNEVIDEKCVLEKKDEYKLPIEQNYEQFKENWNDFSVKVWTYLSDPANRENIKIGIKIAGKLLKNILKKCGK